MKFFKHLAAILLAITCTLMLIPSNVSFAADSVTLLTRDPFYNFSSSYNYYTSEHFQFIWGNSGDASQVTTEFLQGNAQNLENCWHVYMDDLGMEAPDQSVNTSLRDGNHYKTNIYISGTGLSGMTDDWAYMSYDSDGFAYMFCCVGSMAYNPPSWVLPHEFGHVVTAHQLGWNSNKYSQAWWEAMGNWYREQYLYSDYSTDETGYGTDFFETYLKNLCLTFPCGRDYYAAWPFFQYLTENPDNMDGYGETFVKTMLQQGQVDEYPFDIVERLANADLKDTLGNFAKHMAALDFKNGDSYRSRLNELLAQGDWNWQQIYTMLEPIAGEENTYVVPTERAPQFAGMNLVPLSVTGNSISVTLTGLSDIEGADWRACIVQLDSNNNPTYSDLFSDGDTMTVSKISNLSSAYLSVIATPDQGSYTKAGLPYGDGSEFSESLISYKSKQQYPYEVTIQGASIQERTVSTTSANWWESSTYTKHANGGGLVCSTASVADSVYVGPNAIVKGSATVTGNVRIEDHAVVEGSASVSGNAVIGGYAIIAENAVISGNARIDDTAMVMGTATVTDYATVTESACVYGNYSISGHGTAKGMAFCVYGGNVSGYGVVDGDWYDDDSKSVSKGTAFGWVVGDSYISSLTDNGTIRFDYEFDSNSASSFADKYNSTWGYSNQVTWDNTKTGASGVTTLNGSTSYLTLDRAALYTQDFEFQTAILPRSSTGTQTIFYYGNDSAYMKLEDVDGLPVFSVSNGTNTSSITGTSALTKGKWAVIRVQFSGDTINLIVDGTTVATGSCSIDPEDIASAVDYSDDSAAYRFGADNTDSHNLNASVDFIRIYATTASAPTETYSETETISDETTTTTTTTTEAATTTTTTTETTTTTVSEQTQGQVLAGDLDLNMTLNGFDLAKMRTAVLENQALDARLTAAGDLDANGSVGVTDCILLQRYLTGSLTSFPCGNIVTYLEG